MPTYEYACRSCGEHLEVVQSFKDDPLTECPNCTGELRKVFSAAGIIFKGSGWHIKDYGTSRSGAAKPAETGGDTKASESTKASDSKGDTAAKGAGEGSKSASSAGSDSKSA